MLRWRRDKILCLFQSKQKSSNILIFYICLNQSWFTNLALWFLLLLDSVTSRTSFISLGEGITEANILNSFKKISGFNKVTPLKHLPTQKSNFPMTGQEREIITVGGWDGRNYLNEVKQSTRTSGNLFPTYPRSLNGMVQYWRRFIN